MTADLLILLMILVPGAGAILVYGVARLLTRRNGVLAGVTALLYALALGAALYLSAITASIEVQTWALNGNPILEAAPAGLLISTVVLALGFLVALYSGRYLALDHRYEHYYPLLLLLGFAVVGMVLSVDLFTLYLFTVCTSAATYVLVAFRRRTETAIEAGFKYAIMGGMASILVLTGIGFVHRSSGSLTLPLSTGVKGIWGALGLALMLSGYLVKAAIFPAHTWLPDAHGRAPSSISAMLSGIIVQAYVYVMIKVGLGVGLAASELGWLVVVLATLSMTVGNLMALRQAYGKRLLAYSSIAQVGYISVALGLGLAYGEPEPIAAGLYLLVAHAAMKGLAFLCKGIFHFYCDATLVRELDGLAYRMPVAATCFVLSLASLGGIAPLAGFTAKFQIFTSAMRIDDLGARLVIAIFTINSLLSLGYYLPLMGRVLRRVEERDDPLSVSRWMQVPVIALAVLVVLLGIVPGPVYALAHRAAYHLLSGVAR